MHQKAFKGKDDPLWYKDAIIYQIHIKSFFDSNADGVGDIPGLTQKLDYLQKLGVTAIWVLPFYPSPLRDDGYDIADYYNIHPQYGTLKDFKEFLIEAHARNIRVITELVINHTSDQHAWFQRARRAKPGSAHRNFYLWNDTPEKFKEARVIFKDFEASNWTWDPVAKAYYWHRFYSHQPDLNFDNPQVQKEVLKIADFWFDMGVDGVRLDAVPYLFEREGTNCENLPETYAFLKKLRAHVDSKFKNKMLLAEANQWPEDACAYFGAEDSCHMAFHFPLMPRMFMALQMEDNFPIKDILEQTPSIPESCQWAIFLRNHDELTLEMVTDEERDYMYRVFAQDPKAKINLGIRRRLAPLLSNNRKKIELMNILLLSLPGTPIIYYGDDIGMGDNYYLGDRNGVRTPMQWSPDKNAGFSSANPQKLYLPVIIDPEYPYASVNVESQENNLSSPLWWLRRVITMRKKYQAFSRGNLSMLYTDNKRVLAFLRKFKEETILCVMNLSRFSQAVELDLSEYTDFIPKEIFSQNNFPKIKNTPYVITLGPYTHFWFSLKQSSVASAAISEKNIPLIITSNSWEEIFKNEAKDILENSILPQYFATCRWFGQKTETIKTIKITEKIDIPQNNAAIILADVVFFERLTRSYCLPIAYADKNSFAPMLQEHPQSIIAQVNLEDGREGYLYDGIYSAPLRETLLNFMLNKKRISSKGGRLVFYTNKMARTFLKKLPQTLSSQVLKAEQSNSAIIYEHALFLKFFRQIEEGINPDVDMTKFLTEKTNFSNIAAFTGAIQYASPKSEPITIGLLTQFTPNQGDGWNYALDQLGRFYEHILVNKDKFSTPPDLPSLFLDFEFLKKTTIIQDSCDRMFPEMINLLGIRTRQLHDALASSEMEDFIPEHFSLLYQKSVYQSMQGQLKKTFLSLRSQLKKLSAPLQKEAEIILNNEKNILKKLSRITEKKLSAAKIRVHGDYHLGQVLFTGKDFTIIDFEGEPNRSISERKIKRSSFRDLSGMLRSFHYAAFTALLLKSSVTPEDIEFLNPWAQRWYYWTGQQFMRGYLESKQPACFIPKQQDEIELLLETFILDKAIYELNYELNNRPNKIIIPLKGLKDILKSS